MLIRDAVGRRTLLSRATLEGLSKAQVATRAGTSTEPTLAVNRAAWAVNQEAWGRVDRDFK